MSHMKRVREVPIPALMQHLDLDRRGYPIPANAMRDVKNEPAFTVNNSHWVDEHQKRHAEVHCGICGGVLTPGVDMWFLGGPMSAFHEYGAYNDGPLHRDCARYALQVCPYLALPKGVYNKRLDEKGIRNPLPDYVITADPTMIADKPPCYVMGLCDGFNLSYHPSAALGISLDLTRFVPVTLGGMGDRWLKIEVWVDGEHVDDQKLAAQLVEQGLKDALAALGSGD